MILYKEKDIFLFSVMANETILGGLSKLGLFFFFFYKEENFQRDLTSIIITAICIALCSSQSISLYLTIIIFSILEEKN